MAQRTFDNPADGGAASWMSRATASARSAILPDPYRDGGRADLGAVWAARLARLVPRLLLIAAVALLVSAIALFAFRAAYADKVYPAVAVGGMTVEEAAATVERRAAELEQGTVSFTYNGQTWSPTLAELGASIDVESSVDAAWQLGRDDNAVERLGFTNALLRGDQLVPLRTTIDRNALRAWFDAVNADIDHRAVDASIIVEGTSVTITPEQTGTIIDEEAATALILQSLRTLQPVQTDLPTRVEQPKIFAADLEARRAELEAALDGPILATFEGRKWDIPAADLARYVTVAVAWRDGGSAVDVTLDTEALTGYLRDGFAGQIDRSPVDAQIAWSTDQGGLIALEPSIDGATLDPAAFADAIAASFLADQAPVSIPVVYTKPAVDSNNLAALGIDGLLARGDSNYVGGNQDRDTNIEVGTKLLNGELIAPGEEFSFNGAVGEITADKGFVEAGVIEAETIGRDVGGGICQVSTTTFRAALLAGMPMTEWWPHTLRLKGYERDGWTAGFDASILQSGSNPEYWGDFRFLNDTNGYMLIQAWNEYPYNIVEIYGNDDGRTVTIGEPTFKTPEWKYEDKEVVDPEKPAGTMQQTQWPTEPYEVVFTRTVAYASGEVAERQFYSPYQGSGNVFVVSPDMKGKSPVGQKANGG